MNTFYATNKVFNENVETYVKENEMLNEMIINLTLEKDKKAEDQTELLISIADFIQCGSVQSFSSCKLSKFVSKL